MFDLKTFEKDFFLARTPKIYFGPGMFERIPNFIGELGSRAAVITGSSSLENSGKKEILFRMLKCASINYVVKKVRSEPTCELVDRISNSIREFNPDFIIAIGGGSVIDAGKAVACMLEEEGSVLDLLEDVGTRKPSGRKRTFIAVPTTAGTGSEATKNAVISGNHGKHKSGFKKSLRHDNYVPDIALVDPSLTLSCAPLISAQSGIDAFTQLLESFVSRGASYFTDSLAKEALHAGRGIFPNLRNLGKDDISSRCVMSYAALISGITLTNAGLGAVHGFASSIGGLFPIPHGAICGALLTAVCEVNIAVLMKKKEAGSFYLQKYAEAAEILTGQKFANLNDALDGLIAWIRELTERLEIPPLREYGMTEEDFEKIVSQTSARNNPVELSGEDLTEVLKRSL